MTKKLLLFFTCLWTLPACSMQGALTKEDALYTLRAEQCNLLTSLEESQDNSPHIQEYQERLIQKMRQYPDSEDVWIYALTCSMAMDISLVGIAPQPWWEVPLAAAKFVFGTEFAQEIASEIASVILIQVLTGEYSIFHFEYYASYLTVLFHYGAQFSIEAINAFPSIATLFEQYALQLAQTTPFSTQDKHAVAYHLLKNAVDKTNTPGWLNKEDIYCDNTLLELASDNIMNFMRNQAPTPNGVKRCRVKSSYGPSLLSSTHHWSGRLFHLAYATTTYSDQTDVQEYLKNKAQLAGCILQEILFQGQKLSLSCDEIFQALKESNIHVIRDNNPDVTVDHIFNILLQDDQKALQYYRINKERILNSILQNGHYSISDIIEIVEEIRAQGNNLFSRLKDLASCSIQ